MNEHHIVYYDSTVLCWCYLFCLPLSVETQGGGVRLNVFIGRAILRDLREETLTQCSTLEWRK